MLVKLDWLNSSHKTAIRKKIKLKKNIAVLVLEISLVLLDKPKNFERTKM